MTILINLLAPPSSGKSTTMGELFTSLKYKNKNVEMVPEWVKPLAYDGTPITEFTEYYIFGKELYRQSRLFDKVDYVISDSPVLLKAFYQNYYSNNKYNSIFDCYKEFENICKEKGIKIYNFFLNRNKPYNPVGRYETEEESNIIGDKLLEYLDLHNIDFEYLDCEDNKRLDIILEKIGEN